MKSGIHPEYVETQVTCTCGNTFTTRSTAKNGVIHADVCSNCHPFYTGKQKILDTGGRVARFQQRYGKKTAGKKPEPENRRGPRGPGAPLCPQPSAAITHFAPAAVWVGGAKCMIAADQEEGG